MNTMYCFTDFCRLCLTKSSILINIQTFDVNQQTYLSKIVEVLPKHLNYKWEIFPSMICENCQIKVDSCYNFIQNSVKSHNLLLNYYSKLVSTDSDKNISTSFAEYFASSNQLTKNFKEVSTVEIIDMDLSNFAHQIKQEQDENIEIIEHVPLSNFELVTIKTEKDANESDDNDPDSIQNDNICSNYGNSFEMVLIEDDNKSVNTLQTKDVPENIASTSKNPVTSEEINSVTVCELQQMNFWQLSFHEKLTIKKRGRATPDIQISQPGISNNKKYIRSFNCEWYHRKSWLCGCETKNALFCFPCLLFGGDITWTKDGFKNINKMKEKTDKHEKSRKHIENIISLTLLGNIPNKEKLSDAYKLSINEHNIKVRKNREILSKIIDCILFCGDDYPRLINFASKLDPDLKNHLETNLIFKDVSTEILNCLLDIYYDEIRAEIKQASFIAVMVEDISNISEISEIVIIFRYVLNGQILERFLGFFIPENQTSDGVSKCILEQLNKFLPGNAQKLVAQTFDGKGKKSEVATRIKTFYNNAHFISCYSHDFDSIARNAANVSTNAKIFFSTISGISTFFSKSQQRKSILTKYLRCDILKWDASLIYDYLEPLKRCFTDIQTTWNTDQTIAEATGILKCLNDENFKFWLEFFQEMNLHIEVTYYKIRNCDLSVHEISECLTDFKSAIYEIKNSKYCENSSKTLTAEAKAVCDWICVDITDRYSATEHIVAAKLLNKQNFKSFKSKLPTDAIILTSEAFSMIEKDKLATELKVFYSRTDLHNFSNLIDLLKFIFDNNLDNVLSEITKLINILLTIPMITSETERCFTTMENIKSFLRTVQNPEGLNALAVLALEKNLLNNHPEIKEKIINLFAQSETRKMDFVLK